MKKKNLNMKLRLRKDKIASFNSKKVTGGIAYSPPITVEQDVCQPSDICSDKETCPYHCITMREDACYTDPIISCTPDGCGSMVNCQI
ncbi:hypothetical protein [uncultured Kordia sp.]|uniref:hypothetical protein n=1 Tax=uncultured Kordia sp. TaxID=507699 RepID=UPI002619A99D|nr:hypothetical protein [uncultured Kordia sp.]